MEYKQKSIYELENYRDIVNRLDNLTAFNSREWGTMKIGQMLAHCNQPIEMAIKNQKVSRTLLGFLFGRWIKKGIYNYKPYKPELPTASEFRIEDNRDFEESRQKLKSNLEIFFKAGEKGCPKHPHPFYGNLTSREWGLLQYKHLNHHLLQFGG